MTAEAGDAAGEHVVREGTIDEVIRGAASWCIVHGDALHVLRDLPDGSVSAFITDPPYSSGGAFRGDRVKGTTAKYVSTGSANKALPGFDGQGRRVIGFEINREWAVLARERVRADVSGSDCGARTLGQQALFHGLSDDEIGVLE
jgi:hypothetical protein